MEDAKILFRGHGPFTVDEAYEVAVDDACSRLERSRPVVESVLTAMGFKDVLVKAFEGVAADGALFAKAPTPKTKTKKNPEGPESSKDANGPPKKTRKKRA